MTYAEYINQTGVNPPANPIGWIEKDGIPGRSSPDEDFNMNDGFSHGILVQLYRPSCHNISCDNGIIITSDNRPIDGQWLNWGSWSSCSVSCGGGSRNRTREYLAPICNGNAPSGDQIEYEHSCSPLPCPCTWTIWSTWSNCNTNGSQSSMRKRYRDCLPSGDHEYQDECCRDNQSCQAPFVPVSTDCPNKCEYINGAASCSQHDECGVTCGCPGNKYMLNDTQCVPLSQCPCRDSNGHIVPPGHSQMEHCRTCTCVNGTMCCHDIPNCNNPCEWSEWSAWSPCNKDCGIGRVKTRKQQQIYVGNCKTQPEPYRIEELPCPNVECPTCIVNNTVYKEYESIPSDSDCLYCICSKVNATHAEPHCQNDPAKTIDCGWSEWSEWGGCTTTCGIGSQMRQRTCDNPPARCGGIQNETHHDFTTCNKGDCSEPTKGIISTTEAPCLLTCPEHELCAKKHCEPTCDTVLNNSPCVWKYDACTCPAHTARDTDSGLCIPLRDCTKCTYSNKTISDGALFKITDNCKEITYKCQNNALLTISETSIACPPCLDGWSPAPTSEQCCRCLPDSEPLTECKRGVQVEPLKVTFDDNSVCQSVYDATLTSCAGSCKTYDESSLKISVNNLNIISSSTENGSYEFKSSCSWCGGPKVISYLPMVCDTASSEKQLKLIGLPQITSCSCRPCCPSGCGDTVDMKEAKNCSDSQNFTFNNATFIEQGLISFTASDAQSDHDISKIFGLTNDVYYEPINKEFAVTISFGVSVAKVLSVSFNQQQLSSVQVSWATLHDGSITSVTKTLSSTEGSSTLQIDINDAARAVTIYGNCPSCDGYARLNSLAVTANVCDCDY